MKATTDPGQIRLTWWLSAYRRVTIDNPPTNVMGPGMVRQFQEVINTLEADEHVRVVVFDIAVGGHFLSRSDFLPNREDLTALPPGPAGLLHVDFEIADGYCSMTRGETIQTKNSRKYGPRDARVLLRAGGWSPLAEWEDPEELFSVILATAGPDPSTSCFCQKVDASGIMEYCNQAWDSNCNPEGAHSGQSCGIGVERE